MFHTDRQEKFSLRKYKDGRTDSKLIGATILATGVALAVGASPVAANVTSNGTDTATMVTDTSKVSSTAATTFTDDKDASKTVKVDAVLEKGTAEPTKANSNTGAADGTDTLNVKSEATVNYKLDSDKSLLKSETVEAGTGTVTTPYDKKGLAYDTDGKDYRESTVTQQGAVVSKDTGKKDTVEANGKVYEYAGKSEVEGADKLTYDKTRFNDIEAAVSPEGMHNKLGEIDYTKTKGKVYLVEETADGQYGKYVVADNGVTSDEDAVTKWNDGQADAKEFTKENVTLQEGDTILVLDKDTYAVGQGKAVTKTKKGTTSFSALSVPDEKELKFRRESFSSHITTDVTFDTPIAPANHYLKPGADGIYGTADDIEIKPSEDPTYALMAFNGGYDGSQVENVATGEVYSYNHRIDRDRLNKSLKDVLKDYTIANYKALDFLEGKATDATEIENIKAARARLDAHLKKLEDDIQSGKLDMGLLKHAPGDTSYNEGRVVLHTPIDLNSGFPDATKLDEALARFPEIIGELTVSAGNPTETSELNGNTYRKIVSTTEYKYSPEGSNAYIDVETTKKIKEYTVYNGTPDDYIPLVETEPDKETTVTTLVNKGKVEIAADGTVTVTGDAKVTDEKYIPTETVAENKYIISGDYGTRTRTETTESATFTKKEIITPIRAYKVMGEEKPVVTHYYNLKITKEEAGEATATKQGSVVIKYVTTDGKQLKTETDKDNVTLETKTIVSLYSGETKVDERTDVKTVEQNYDTTPKQYPTLVDADTGFTYEYVGLKQGSPAASGKVVEGTTEVVYEYRLVSEEERTPSSSVVTKTGSVDVKHVVINEDGTLKTLKETEVVKDKVPVEYEDTYVTYSKGVKVSERKEKRTITERYDTTDKQYPTLKDKATGLVYKYVGQTSDSAPAAGDVTEGEKHVIYSYTLDKQEETTPSKTVEAKGSVVVKYVDAEGNEIKDSANVVTDAVVKTTKTYATKSGDVVLSTRDEVMENDVNYNAAEKKVDTITKDGKKYVFRGVYEVSDKYNNVLEETGKVKEGITTVVYQYDYIIPVDPTKPNEGDNNPPKPEDKIPNDPQNRSYKDLGLLKEVKRDITYVYENGPKAGQEASAPVNQTARFTRTAEINSRTGEVTYTTDWTPEQKLAEVVSPEIKDYTVDKAKVDELAVTHESKDSAVIVKYSQNKPNSVRDYAKDKKGTVIVKFVDINENFLADDVVAKNNVIVAEATTTTTGDKEETTYKATGEEYAVTAPETIVVDGVTFRLKRVLPAGDKFKNTVEEKGLVKEGVTTIVYQYVMQIDAPKVEVPEFEGGVVPLDPPVVDIPELKIPEKPKPQPNPTPTPTPEPNPAPAPTPQPTPTPQRNETPKPPVPVAEDSGTPAVPNKPVPSNYNPDGNTYPAPSTEVTQLPNTGTESNAALVAFGFVGILSGLSIVLRKKDNE